MSYMKWRRRLTAQKVEVILNGATIDKLSGMGAAADKLSEMAAMADKLYQGRNPRAVSTTPTGEGLQGLEVSFDIVGSKT